MITLKADELSNVLVHGNAALPALASLTAEREALNPDEQAFCTIGIRKLHQSKGFLIPAKAIDTTLKCQEWQVL